MSRATGTLTVLASVAVFVVASVLGIRLLTADADRRADVPTCEDRQVTAGEPLTANLVEVDVLNASGREGLANRVSINLQRKGFLGGSVGNSTSELDIPAAAILAADPTDPRVQLVALQLPGAPVMEPDIELGDGVTVVLGPGFQAIDEAAPTEVPSDRDLTLCVPTAEP